MRLLKNLGIFLGAWAIGINIVRYCIYPVIEIGLNEAGCAWVLLAFIVVYTVCLTIVFVNSQ